LLAYRELGDGLGMKDLAAASVSECRRGKNIRQMLAWLLRNRGLADWLATTMSTTLVASKFYPAVSSLRRLDLACRAD
jgi:hypothetical protein